MQITIDFLELSNMTLSQHCFLSSSNKSRRSTTEMSQTVKNVIRVDSSKAKFIKIILSLYRAKLIVDFFSF